MEEVRCPKHMVRMKKQLLASAIITPPRLI